MFSKAVRIFEEHSDSCSTRKRDLLFEQRWNHPKSYVKELLFMNKCHEEVIKGIRPSTVIFTRHDICRTCGALDSNPGLQWIKTNRGGGQTYHDPGQILCYPIIDLAAFKIKQGSYNEILCQWLYNSIFFLVCTEVSLYKEERPEIMKNGLWLSGKKVAFIGTRISQGVTLHGFSVNFNTDLNEFTKILPCGYKNLPVGNLNIEANKIVEALIKFCPFK
jgi:lipoyl(octanoyl) transferase